MPFYGRETWDPKLITAQICVLQATHYICMGSVLGILHALFGVFISLATMFDYPSESRRLIYTTNTIEGYHRQLRKVVKTKGSFPSAQTVRKLLYLVNENETKKWSMPLRDWAKILNQLTIRYETRMPIP